MIFIHVILNDICLLCCHLPQKLFHDTPVFSVQMYLSVHKLLQQYTKNYIDSIHNEISTYLNIDTKIIHVIIYDISISSSYCHCNLMWTAITCTTISTHEILQLLMTYRLATIFYRKMNWYELWDISTILWLSLSSSPPIASCIISYMQKEYTKWYDTKQIYMLNI